MTVIAYSLVFFDSQQIKERRSMIGCQLTSDRITVFWLGFWLHVSLMLFHRGAKPRLKRSLICFDPTKIKINTKGQSMGKIWTCPGVNSQEINGCCTTFTTQQMKRRIQYLKWIQKKNEILIEKCKWILNRQRIYLE